MDPRPTRKKRTSRRRSTSKMPSPRTPHRFAVGDGKTHGRFAIGRFPLKETEHRFVCISVYHIYLLWSSSNHFENFVNLLNILLNCRFFEFGSSRFVEFRGLGRHEQDVSTPTPKAKALPKALFVGTLSETTSR